MKLGVGHPERAEGTSGQCTHCEREGKELMKDNARSLQGEDGAKKGSGEQHERERRSLQQYGDDPTARGLRDAPIVCAFTMPRLHDIPPIHPNLTRAEGESPSSVNGPPRFRPQAGGSTRTVTRRRYIVNGAVQFVLHFAYIIERLYSL